MAKRNITRAKSNKDAELHAIYEGVMTCQPVLSPSLVEEVADAIRDNDQMGVPWRITAVLASKDGEFFKQVANDVDTAKTMAGLIDGLQGFSKRLEAMKKMADAVTARLQVAGCNHIKFDDWVKEAT